MHFPHCLAPQQHDGPIGSTVQSNTENNLLVGCPRHVSAVCYSRSHTPNVHRQPPTTSHRPPTNTNTTAPIALIFSAGLRLARCWLLHHPTSPSSQSSTTACTEVCNLYLPRLRCSYMYLSSSTTTHTISTWPCPTSCSAHPAVFSVACRVLTLLMHRESST